MSTCLEFERLALLAQRHQVLLRRLALLAHLQEVRGGAKVAARLAKLMLLPRQVQCPDQWVIACSVQHSQTASTRPWLPSRPHTPCPCASNALLLHGPARPPPQPSPAAAPPWRPPSPARAWPALPAPRPAPWWPRPAWPAAAPRCIPPPCAPPAPPPGCRAPPPRRTVATPPPALGGARQGRHVQEVAADFANQAKGAEA